MDTMSKLTAIAGSNGRPSGYRKTDRRRFFNSHQYRRSAELEAMWNKYRRQFAYAADIEYSQIIAVLKMLTA